MINAINTGGSMPPPKNKESQSLNDEQLATISDTLSQFDADNVTEADAISIVEAFSEAGIQPGKALAEAMADFGFDAKSIGDLANVDGREKMPPPPPRQSENEIIELVDFLTEAIKERLSNSNNENLTDEDKQFIMSQLNEKYGLGGGSVINTTA